MLYYFSASQLLPGGPNLPPGVQVLCVRAPLHENSSGSRQETGKCPKL